MENETQNLYALPTDEQVDAFARRFANIAMGLAWSHKWYYEKAAEFTAFAVSVNMMHLRIPPSINRERIIKAAISEATKVYYVYIGKHYTQREQPQGDQVYLFKQT